MSIEQYPVTMNDGVTVNFLYPNSGSLSGTISADGNSLSGTYSIGNTNCGGNKSGTWMAHRSTPLIVKPVLIFPSDKSIDQPLNITLNWEEVANAAGYSVEVSEANNFSNLIVSVNDTLTNQYTVNNLESNKTYYWRTGSLNACGEVSWSETWSFTTLNTVEIMSNRIDYTVQIYPNPLKNRVMIKGIEDEYSTISVLTVEGTIIKQFTGAGIKELELEALPAGIYMLKIANQKGMVTKKIVKQE